MKRHLTLIPLLAVLMSSCQTTSFWSGMGGDLEGNVYRNETYGFALHVPPSWEVGHDTEMEKRHIALTGNPSLTDTALSCHPVDARKNLFMMCTVQKNTTANGALNYAITSTGAALGSGMRFVRLHNEEFSHVQLLPTKGGKTYAIDLYAIDINESTIVIILSHGSRISRAAMDKLVADFFERLP